MHVHGDEQSRVVENKIWLAKQRVCTTQFIQTVISSLRPFDISVQLCPVCSPRVHKLNYGTPPPINQQKIPIQSKIPRFAPKKSSRPTFPLAISHTPSRFAAAAPHILQCSAQRLPPPAAPPTPLPTMQHNIHPLSNKPSIVPPITSSAALVPQPSPQLTKLRALPAPFLLNPTDTSTTYPASSPHSTALPVHDGVSFNSRSLTLAILCPFRTSYSHFRFPLSIHSLPHLRPPHPSTYTLRAFCLTCRQGRYQKLIPISLLTLRADPGFLPSPCLRSKSHPLPGSHAHPESRPPLFFSCQLPARLVIYPREPLHPDCTRLSSP